MEDQFAELKKQHNQISDEHQTLTNQNNQLKDEVESLDQKHQALEQEHQKLLTEKEALSTNLSNLKSSYKALEKNSSQALRENMKKNRSLLAQLEEKEKLIKQEQVRLNQLKSSLEQSSTRLAELERIMAEKDNGLKALKESLSKALYSFEGKGLTVENRGGKVYVSMENKLLFSSGSWTVETQGRKAVKALGDVLAENPDISILIEGHTDNDKIIGDLNGVKNNWELSTKRATAIVNILCENSQIDKKNLTAAGKGQYAPIASNETSQGKAKNRRIEIVLTPKLDQVTKMLEEL